MTQIALARRVPRSTRQSTWDGDRYPTQGSFFACGMDGTGYPVCWGDSTQAQTGAPATRILSCAVDTSEALTCTWSGETPIQAHYGLPDSQSALEVCAGIDGGMICVLDGNGLPLCWTDPQLPVPDVAVAREQGPLHGLTCGFGHACALTAAGEAVCWGDNQAGQAAPPGNWVRLSADEAIIAWYPETLP